MSRAKRVERFMQRLGQLKDDSGKAISDFNQGVKQGFSETPENTRKELFDSRASIGLDEPPQLQSTLNSSGVGEVVREGLTIFDLPGGFSDRRLYERGRQGIGLQPEPELWEDIIPSRLNSDNTIIRESEERKLHDRVQLFKELSRTNPQVANHLGTAVGQLGADVTLDKSRAIYWLANAVQATTRLVNEAVLMGANPNLNTRRRIPENAFVEAVQGKKRLLRKTGSFDNPIGPDDRPLPEPEGADLSQGGGWLNPKNFEPADQSVKAAFIKDDDGKGKKVFQQRRLNNNMLALAGTGLTSYAINQGVGLAGNGIEILSPREGYQAASPSEDDPRKTKNVIEEVGLKYLMGRTGNILPYAEFSKERPDVSKQEYNAYRGFMRDRELDLNPFDDGKVNVGAGFIKYTNDDDSVHGKEINFLGKSVPIDTAFAPTAGAIMGAALGGLLPNVRQLRLKGQRPGRKFSTLQQIKEKPLKEVPKLLYNSLPEVAPKQYDKTIDLANPLIKGGSTADNLTGKLEDYFMEENKVTGQRDLNVGRQVQAVAGGSLGGLLIAGELGRRNEEDRQRRKFNESNPLTDFDEYKKATAQMLDDEYKQRASIPQEVKDDKGKSYTSRVSQQENLQDYATRQLAQVETMLSKEDKAIAREKINRALSNLAEVQQIEDERQNPKKKEDEPYPLFDYQAPY